MNKEEKSELAKKMVMKFIFNFRETIGTTPKVKYSIEGNIPSLNEIYNLVNEYYQNKMKNETFNEDISISDKGREETLVHYRCMYYSIARDFGYKLDEIGRVVNKNHATVLNGLKKIQPKNELRLKLKKQLLES